VYYVYKKFLILFEVNEHDLIKVSLSTMKNKFYIRKYTYRTCISKILYYPLKSLHKIHEWEKLYDIYIYIRLFTISSLRKNKL